MATANEVENYVEGLSGTEIINDLLFQLESKLRQDNNLRQSDNYPGGYKGHVEIHLTCYGMDAVDVISTISVKSDKVTPPTAENGLVESAVDAKVEIPIDPALDMVRDRSNQPIPTMGKDESGAPQTNYRRYAKKATGGATGESL